MKLQKLIVKITIATIVLILVMLLLGGIIDIFSPILSNDIAVDQLQNDNAYFYQLQVFHKIKQVIMLIPIIPYFIFVIKNIYNYMITNKESI